MNIKIDEKLSHLTQDDITELMTKYYSSEKASDLVKEYNINIVPSRLYTLFPPNICKDNFCPNCNTQMLKKRPSKSSLHYNTNMPFCPNCNHKDSSSCNCDSCIDKKKLQAKQLKIELEHILSNKKKLIHEIYNLNNNIPIDIDTISFRDKVFLGALFRTCLSEDMMTILPLNSSEKKLSPTSNYTTEIVKRLIHNNLIVVDPHSDVNSFPDSNVNSEYEFPHTYYIYMVKYRTNINFLPDYNTGISTLINPSDSIPIDSKIALSIWKEIALEECLEYFQYQLKSVKFDITIGEKTISTFKDLLNDFSVSQIFAIIYRSVANATKYYQESNISRKQAANSIIGGCQRYAEKALLENWNIKGFNRPYDVPQSIISEFFFNRITKIGNLGFNMPPTSL